MLRTIAVENYRSLKDLIIEFDQLNVITGPNGSGKSNIYRAIRLINDIVRDGALSSLAQEGGLQNALHAGVRGAERVALRLGIHVDDLRYAIDLGLPQLGPFPRDPEVKSETVWHGTAPRPSSILAERKNQMVRLLDDNGSAYVSDWTPRPEESMLATLTDPMQAPELYLLRETARGWRFYDSLRVDSHSPARRPTPSTFSPTLAADGSNLAAALATVLRIGNEPSFNRAISDAFDGASVHIEEDNRGIAHLAFDSGLRRALDASEISDGTLRFLMLATILHSPRPPKLLVLNEPESSLHASLLPALAAMIREASSNSQVVVVSHSKPLVEALSVGSRVIEIVNSEGETQIPGTLRFESSDWTWPKTRR